MCFTSLETSTHEALGPLSGTHFRICNMREGDCICSLDCTPGGGVGAGRRGQVALGCNSHILLSKKVRLV